MSSSLGSFLAFLPIENFCTLGAISQIKKFNVTMSQKYKVNCVGVVQLEDLVLGSP